jgi:hypothetical protein
VLRFFAYRQRLAHQKGALKYYLDKFLKHGNLLGDEILGAYKALFEDTVSLVYDVLGTTAFHLLRERKTGWAWFNRPTTVLFDPIMFVFSQNLGNQVELRARSHRIRASLPDFYKKNYQKFEGRYTNLSNITERNELFEAFIQEVLASPP